MASATLERAEFLYLLRSLDTRAIVGVNNSRLFADNLVEEQTLLDEGYRLLLEHGWLRPVGENEMDLDLNLYRSAAIISDPERVLVTSYLVAPGATQTISHYFFEEYVVELYLNTEEQYQITRLANLATAVRRLQSVLDIPEQPTHAAPAVTAKQEPLALARQSFRNGEEEQGVALLAGEGLDQSAQEWLVDVLSTGLQTAEITLLRVSAGKVLGQRYMLLFQGPTFTGMGDSDTQDSTQWTFQSLSFDAFAGAISHHMAELAAIQHLPMPPPDEIGMLATELKP